MQELKNRIDEEKAKILSLCEDFRMSRSISDVIADISNLLNSYIEDEDLYPKVVRQITYDTTELITFLARVHETVSRIQRLESNG